MYGCPVLGCGRQRRALAVTAPSLPLQATGRRHPCISDGTVSTTRFCKPAQDLGAAAQGGRTQAGAQRLRSAEGGALKGTFDEQTWSTLVELGAAPTPVHGQIGCYKTPRELKPSAATPPLIHSAAGLPGKQTPCSGAPPATGRLTVPT